MPRKPKRPCSYPGCPHLTDGRFCEEHARAEAKRYEKYDRDPAVRRRYGRAWKRIRDKYVSEHPFCEICYDKGILVETEDFEKHVNHKPARLYSFNKNIFGKKDFVKILTFSNLLNLR